MMDYDAIIVGGGIGGTAIGALLAHQGWKVALFDQNKNIGGRCSSFEKDGFIVDYGVHLFGVGKKGSLGKILEIVGEDEGITWLPIQTPVLRVGGQRKKFSQKSMIELVRPEEQKNLETIFNKIFSLSDDEIQKLWYVPLAEWINQFSTDPVVHALLGSINAEYFVISTKDASTAEFIKCFREVVLARSSAYPQGGCIAIPKAYQTAMEKRGGKTFLNTKIRKILIENGRAVGVMLPDKTVVRSPVIISNADIKATVNQLVGAEYFPTDYVKRINELTYSYKAVVLKLALNKKITDDQLVINQVDPNEAILVSAETLAGKKELPEKIGSFFVCPSNFDPSLAPPGCQLLGLSACVPDDYNMEAWKELLLNTLYEMYPEAREHVLWQRIDSPKLMEVIGGEEGNVIGIAQTVNQIHERRPSVVSPIKGLFFASAEAGGHGIGTELAASSALELASVLV